MRKQIRVTIEAEGRDKGKTFELTEMSPVQAEKWAARALFALGRAGVEVPDDIMSAGLAGIVALGIRAFGALRFDDAEPLMDEMMQCVRYVNQDSGIVRNLVDSDIEEIRTRLKLRGDLVELHTGFSIAARLSASDRAA